MKLATILAVDDNPANLSLLFDVLDEAGFEVLVSQNGESALKRAKNSHPNIILLDVMMPGMDGFETCRQLRANATTKDIPIMFMTALSETVDKVKSFALGAVDYITKPIEPEEVLARVNTPLNAILGDTQLLKEGDNLTEHQKEKLEIINRSGEHLLTVLTDILDIAKIETGRMELQLNEFDFSEFLKRIADMIRIRAKQKGLSFVYEHDPDLPRSIHADEKRLRQVLLNLLGNAVKFTEHGKVVFRVIVCSESEKFVVSHAAERSDVPSPRHSVNFVSDYKRIHFEIEDTGIGIAPEKQEEIFLPFQQIDGKYHSVEGTGLGLAISRQLVTMMGGELTVKSTVGKGSVFWFDLNVPEMSGDIFEEKILAKTRSSGKLLYKTANAATRIEAESPPLVPLPPEIVNRLIELAERGNPKKLLAELDNPGQLDEQYLPIIEKVRQLVKNYQIDQCIELLKAEENRN